MSNLLSNLNEKQKEAVLTTQGPVMAIAGAGSGKTSVLTKRIAYLIEKGLAELDEILAITFTNKAAKEMKERVMQLTGVTYPPSWISTFHSMCARILRTRGPINCYNIELLGYRRDFVILDDDDTSQLVKSILKKLNYDPKTYKYREIKGYVMKIKQDDGYVDDFPEPKRTVCLRVFEEYQRRLKDNNLLDFADLQLKVIDLLEENEIVRKFYQDKFKYVHVDEFQDTNNTQFHLMKLLVGSHNNVFVVGDQDQSIYKFRGANVRNIDHFKSEYPDYRIILLEQNYRSTNTILKAANAVISENSNRIPKKLFSTRGDGDSITVYKGVTSRDEIEYVAREILRLQRRGIALNDIAVLYRTNNTSRQFEDVFLQKQIQYRVRGNTSFFKRKEIKDFASYLRLILNINDAYSFSRVISVPRRGIGEKTLDKLYSYAADNELPLLDAIKISDQFLSRSASNKIKMFVNMILDFRGKLTDYPFNDFIDYILENSGYLKMLEDDDKGDVRYENLLEFKTILAENNELFEDANKEEMLFLMLEDIALKAEETNDEIEDGVDLMTLHSAKGLEYRYVFMVNVEETIFPAIRSVMDGDIDEERRLMYVGITRAKDKLYITSADVRQTFGEIRRNGDSQFVKNIPEDLKDLKGLYELKTKTYNVNSYQRKVKKQTKSVPSVFMDNSNKNDISKGNKVNHKVFGDGVVVSVAGDNCVIAFKHPHGVKKLLKDHPAITKK